MKAYWDSSALVESTLDADLRERLVNERAFTRTYSLTETFSALTGKAEVRMDANAAAVVIKSLVQHLEFVDLSADEVTHSLCKAQSLGVRGGRVHDYMHALAAQKSGASVLLTADRHDFNGLVPSLTIEQV